MPEARSACSQKLCGQLNTSESMKWTPTRSNSDRLPLWCEHPASVFYCSSCEMGDAGNELKAMWFMVLIKYFWAGHFAWDIDPEQWSMCVQHILPEYLVGTQRE